MGLDLANPMPSAFATRWDSRGPDAEICDHGAIGEDAQGVFCRVSPMALLGQRPALWPVVDSVLAGGLQEMTERDWNGLSAYHHAAKRILVATIHRSASRG